MWIVRMRFETALDEAEQEKLSRAGLPKFRALEGLLQKYYVRNRDAGVVGGVYLFESKEAAQAYIDGPIVASVGERFRVVGDVEIELLEVEMTLDEA
ncbi:hypothetical protein FK531_11505 [Rhodococcus spelaei]|uniref:Monooxygenase n=1 Tax=Rhodococcus spelaei TaxID=2546320 RepID=A0A541BAI9_9NOCA|nr:YdhR family protein [Rhodococcus spelaei]TQF69352.1 hypothetical protein FK531_11505 [Rhodococcus spelaei]